MDIKKLIRANRSQLLAVFGAFFFMVLVSSWGLSKIVNKQNLGQAEEVLNAAEAVIEVRLQEIEAVLTSTANSIETRLDEGESWSDVNIYLQSLSGSRAWPESSGIIRMQGYLKGMAVPAGMAGNILPSDQTGEYVIALTAGNRADFGVGGASPDSRVSLSFAQILCDRQGDDYGVVELDADITDLSAYINNLQLAGAGYGMLLDRNRNFVVYPERGWRGQPLANGGGAYAEIAERLQQGEANVSAVPLTDSDGEPVVAFYQRLSNDWYVGVATPVAAYKRDYYYMVMTLAALGLLAAGFLSARLLKQEYLQTKM
jgi:hypothetical protein